VLRTHLDYVSVIQKGVVVNLLDHTHRNLKTYIPIISQSKSDPTVFKS